MPRRVCEMQLEVREGLGERVSLTGAVWEGFVEKAALGQAEAEWGFSRPGSDEGSRGCGGSWKQDRVLSLLPGPPPTAAGPGVTTVSPGARFTPQPRRLARVSRPLRPSRSGLTGAEGLPLWGPAARGLALSRGEAGPQDGASSLRLPEGGRGLKVSLRPWALLVGTGPCWAPDANG